ncbi:hypothetical protein NKI78_09655 [Mesorhizobium sp. M0400]|uniref:hypothetical protein n=1 Tax=Mesorhizobium sp. M0400 TaxID=2956941 RepID=UPI00333D1104
MAEAFAAKPGALPVLRGRHDLPEISGRISAIVLDGRLPRYFWAAFFPASSSSSSSSIRSPI